MAEDNRNPYLVITCGNTGSGKTRLMEETLRFLGISNEPYVKILIDDIVENNLIYKREVKKIISKIERYCREKRVHCLDEDCFFCDEDWYYNNPPKFLYDDFKNAYFNARSRKNCNGINPNWDCNELNDHYLMQAIFERKNIVFEFTGQYIPTWLLTSAKLTTPYNIVVSCSVVNMENLARRNKSRASLAVRKFKENENEPAPRLPDVSVKELKKNMKQYKNILNEMYTDCIESYSVEKCGDRQINRLLVFDNNGRDLSLIFDSSLRGSRLDVVNESFGPIQDSPRRKRYRKVLKRKISSK